MLVEMQQEVDVPFLSSFQVPDDVDLIKKMRMKAWDRFLELGLPDQRHESFQYIRLKHLFQETYTAPREVSHTGLGIVFVNGKLQQTDAPKGVIALPFSQAIKTYGTLLSSTWAKSIKEEVDPFGALNAACFQDGLFLYIPPKLQLDTTIEITHVIKGHDGIFCMPKICIFQGAHSQVKILYKHESAIQKYFSNAAIDFYVEENAHSHLIYDGTNKKNEEHSWAFDALRCKLKKNSSLKVIQAGHNAHVHRNDIHAELIGENADVSLNGLWMLKGSNEVHTNVVVHHSEPHATSMQLYKGVLTDHAKSSFQGKIFVRKIAQKTQAYQLNNNLVLSDHAEAHSKPNLEIFADDVKASHGATVGKLDPEQLFYLKTRGFSDLQAKNTLISGFLNEVIDLIPIEKEKKELEQQVHQFLQEPI